MEKWQLKQNHVDQLLKLLKELNFLDKEGRLHKFEGDKFWKQWNELGHSRTLFEECECSKVETKGEIK